MSNDVMIEANALTKNFGNFRALDRVSFEVNRGEVVGFLGPNGAGKSTTMRILTCYLSASAGVARVAGKDVFDEPLAVRQSLGYLPQRAPLYGDMSVWEYLRFVAEVRGLAMSKFKKRMKDVVEVCGLAGVLGKDIGTLSHGYRQRVGLGQALVHDPQILILDEPTSDLDPNEKAEVIRYIKAIGEDRTVVLSTHNLSEVEEACARAIIISKGRIVADGNIDEVRARGGRIRYQVVVDEQNVMSGGGNYRKDPTEAPKAREVEDALKDLEGAISVSETPTDDKAHAFTILGGKTSDLRAEIYGLCVQKGWLLLEMRRDIQKLEDVFKQLTKGDELADRGRPLADADDDYDDDYDDEDLDDEELDDDEDADEADDEELDEDADEADDEELDDEPADDDEDEE
jgi:ABC-2 type transport system ATP-binding protein